MTKRKDPTVPVEEDRPNGPQVFGAKPAEKPKEKAAAKPAGKTVALRDPARAPAEPAPKNLYQAILLASANPAIDAEKFKILVDVQIQLEDREAVKAFTRAFNALQSELPTIDRDGKIDHGEGVTARGHKKLKGSYSTYPNLMRVCRPLLRKHGFTFNNVIEPSDDASRIVVVGYLTHVDGHAMTSRFPLSLDAGPGRSNAQGWGSSSSYGKRYNLILMLDIVSEAPGDQDDDGKPKTKDERVATDRVPEATALSPAEVEQLRAAIVDCGVGEDKFLMTYEIENVDDLPPKRFREALKACADYKAKKAAATKDNRANG